MASFAACPPSPTRRRRNRLSRTSSGSAPATPRAGSAAHVAQTHATAGQGNILTRRFANVDDPFDVEVSSSSSDDGYALSDDGLSESSARRRTSTVDSGGSDPLDPAVPGVTHKTVSSDAQDSTTTAVAAPAPTASPRIKFTVSGRRASIPPSAANTKRTRSFRDFAPKLQMDAMPALKVPTRTDGRRRRSAKHKRDLATTPATLFERCRELVSRLAKPVGYSDNGFEDEFAQVVSECQHFQPVYAVQTMQTRRRNRYANVLPLASTRVMLRPVEITWGGDSSAAATDGKGSGGGSAATAAATTTSPRPRGATIDSTSSYINANYVNGEVAVTDGSGPAYIAAQAPKTPYMDEWWIMIWDECVPAIVMVTKCKEGKKIKAAPYWPEEGGGRGGGDEDDDVDDDGGGGGSSSKDDGPPQLQCGPIELTLLSSTSTDSMVERRIQMRRRQGNGSMSAPRVITQLHFTKWPDFGVPTNLDALDPLLDAMEHIKTEAPSGLTGPTLVHCSAGIGRTGTIIAIDITLRKLRCALGSLTAGTTATTATKNIVLNPEEEDSRAPAPPPTRRAGAEPAGLMDLSAAGEKAGNDRADDTAPPWWIRCGCLHSPLDIEGTVLRIRRQRHGSVVNHVSCCHVPAIGSCDVCLWSNHDHQTHDTDPPCLLRLYPFFFTLIPHTVTI